MVTQCSRLDEIRYQPLLHEQNNICMVKRKGECVEVMGAKAPRGPSRGTPGNPDKIVGCRRLPVFELDKGMSLKIEKRKGGSQT